MPFSFDGVTFGYGRSRAVLEEFTFEFPRGRTVLLGPNGAGKSTLLGLAVTAFRPDDGAVFLDGYRSSAVATRKTYRQLVGWMPQVIQVVPGFTAREQTAYAGWLKGMSRRSAWEGSLSALASVGMETAANQRADRLSGGQLRRVGIAQMLVHNPTVLVMDEPTAGLDPDQRQSFRDILEDVSGQRSAIVSTHQTDDLDEVYDNVAVLADGLVRWCGPTNEFLAIGGSDAVARRAEAAYRHALHGARE